MSSRNILQQEKWINKKVKVEHKTTENKVKLSVDIYQRQGENCKSQRVSVWLTAISFTFFLGSVRRLLLSF